MLAQRMSTREESKYQVQLFLIAYVHVLFVVKAIFVLNCLLFGFPSVCKHLYTRGRYFSTHLEVIVIDSMINKLFEWHDRWRKCRSK